MRTAGLERSTTRVKSTLAKNISRGSVAAINVLTKGRRYSRFATRSVSRDAAAQRRAGCSDRAFRRVEIRWRTAFEKVERRSAAHQPSSHRSGWSILEQLREIIFPTVDQLGLPVSSVLHQFGDHDDFPRRIISMGVCPSSSSFTRCSHRRKSSLLRTGTQPSHPPNGCNNTLKESRRLASSTVPAESARPKPPVPRPTAKDRRHVIRRQLPRLASEIVGSFDDAPQLTEVVRLLCLLCHEVPGRDYLGDRFSERILARLDTLRDLEIERPRESREQLNQLQLCTRSLVFRPLVWKRNTIFDGSGVSVSRSESVRKNARWRAARNRDCPYDREFRQMLDFDLGCSRHLGCTAAGGAGTAICPVGLVKRVDG